MMENVMENMMGKRIISTPAAPAAIGPYSQAVCAGNILYLSGMLGVEPSTGAFIGETAVEQARQALLNIKALLESEGLTLDNVVKTTVFLRDLNEFAAVNEAYGAQFSADPPARSCVEVSRLPKDAQVEIECIAVR